MFYGLRIALPKRHNVIVTFYTTLIGKDHLTQHRKWPWIKKRIETFFQQKLKNDGRDTILLSIPNIMVGKPILVSHALEKTKSKIWSSLLGSKTLKGNHFAIHARHQQCSFDRFLYNMLVYSFRSVFSISFPKSCIWDFFFSIFRFFIKIHQKTERNSSGVFHECLRVLFSKSVNLDTELTWPGKARGM